MTAPTDADIELIGNLNELADLAARDGAVLRAQIERHAADRLTALSAEVEQLRTALATKTIEYEKVANRIVEIANRLPALKETTDGK